MVGLCCLRSGGKALHTLRSSSREIVPQPSLNVRPLRITSSLVSVTRAVGGTGTENMVSKYAETELACVSIEVRREIKFTGKCLANPSGAFCTTMNVREIA